MKKGPQKWFVYVLLCSNGAFYTGITNDLEKRFKLHKAGKGAKYTKIFKPIKIVYKEGGFSKSGALKREHEIKFWTREQKVKRLGLVGIISAQGKVAQVVRAQHS